MADDYLRSIEPLIAIVLGCMRWKSPARGPVTSFLFLRYRLQSFQSWGWYPTWRWNDIRHL